MKISRWLSVSLFVISGVSFILMFIVAGLKDNSSISACSLICMLSSIVFMCLGTWRRNHEKFMAMINVDPVEAFYEKAQDNAGDKDYTNAIQEYTAAITGDPSYAEPYFHRATLYHYFIRKKDEALQDYKTYLELTDFKSPGEAYIAYHRHVSLRRRIFEPIVDTYNFDNIGFIQKDYEMWRKLALDSIKELEAEK